ncbi:peptidoglycan hydrolase [Haladaptatus sp. NG-SE-30]
MEDKQTRRNFIRTVGATAITVPFISSTASAAYDDFNWPTTGQITSDYYDSRDGGTRTHRGIDIDWETGQPIYAARAGTVTTASYTSGYGYRVKIDHDGGYRTRYAHCQSDLKVNVGDWVDRGDHIADLGGSGGYEPHLHFDIKRNGSYVYVPGDAGDWVDTSDPIPKDYAGISGTNGDGSTSYSWPTYSYGDQEEAVYSIQYLLEEHGHALNYHDGIYGSEVQNAVESFQSNHGLAVDGIVGPNTWGELYVTVWDANNDPWWATYGAQHHLRYGQGYSIAVDGYYGPETENAVRDFQSNADITVDGIIGHDTWQALMDIPN